MLVDERAMYLGEDFSRSPKPVPHSREAEESVVAAVLINPDVYKELRGVMSADDFYIHRNKWIWEAFDSLSDRGAAIDIVTVADELESKGRLDEIGGRPYLTSLAADSVVSYNAASYADIVWGHALRRRAIQGANEIAQAAYNESQDVRQLVEIAAKMDLSLQQAAYRSDRMITIAEAAGRDWDRLERIAQTGRTPGLKSGLRDLDHITGGCRQSELIIVGGLRGDGKTSLMLDNAGSFARQGLHVAVFSLEMSSEQIVQRIVSQTADIDGEHIRDSTMTEQEWGLYTRTIEEFENEWSMFLDDTPALTPEELTAKCTRLKSIGKLDIVFVDYVQLMRAPSYFRNREQEIAYISRNLKYLARELDVPVVAGAQVNRESERSASKRLQLHHLRESAALEHDSDVVIFIQPDESDEVIAAPSKIKTITVAKNRNGKTGDCSVLFYGQYTSFRNI